MSVMRKIDIYSFDKRMQWKEIFPGNKCKTSSCSTFLVRGSEISWIFYPSPPQTKTSIWLWFPREVDVSCNSGSDGGGDIGPWLSCWCHCGKSNMPREPASSLSQLLLIGLYYLEQDLNILQIHLQSSTCAGYLKYEVWDLFLEIPDQLLFLTSNTGTDRTSLSPTWTFIVISQVHSWKESRMRRKFSKNKRRSLERGS